MPAKSRFVRLDAFTKTVEDARVRTTSGGIVTIASLLIVLYLVWGEWADYRRVVVRPELIVDKGRGMRAAEILLSGTKLTSIFNSRGENGDSPKHYLSSNTLRAAVARCHGRFRRATNRGRTWRQQGQVGSNGRGWRND